MKPRDLSEEECANLLSAARYGRLGLAKDSQPYVVPMSFVYADGRIYLHSRGSGQKVEYVSGNPSVCFQVDLLEKGRWSSVIAFGSARLSDSVEAKQRMFDAFTAKGQGGHGDKKFSREELERMPMTIWEIEIEEMTGREGVW
ncbi:MAG: pyridoxamine 5'-phosphate oxidase family protein [Methanothrix sp.]|nr:pyridoxamine 5'-phosphate oxidase family protein [Methanothrix sp.]